MRTALKVPHFSACRPIHIIQVQVHTVTVHVYTLQRMGSPAPPRQNLVWLDLKSPVLCGVDSILILGGDVQF
jgi:hypothetical protein